MNAEELKKALDELGKPSGATRGWGEPDTDAGKDTGGGVVGETPEEKAARIAAENAAATLEAAINKQVKALELQRDTFGMASKEVALYHLKMQGATDVQLEQAEAILDTIDNMKAYAATDEAIIDMMADIAEGVKLTEKSFEDLSEAEKKAMEDLSDTGKTAMETLTDAVNGFGAQSSQAMTDFALHGKASFSDMIDSMIEDLVRMMIQEQIMGPLFRGIAGMNSGGGSFCLSGAGAKVRQR